MIKLGDLEYFRPHSRRLVYFNEHDDPKLLGTIEFAGLYIFDDLSLETPDNLLLPDGRACRCPSLKAASFGLLKLGYLGSEFICRQLKTDDAGGAIGILRCHDWIEIDIDRAVVRNDLLDQLSHLDPGMLTIGFSLGPPDEAVQILPVEGFHVETTGAAA